MGTPGPIEDPVKWKDADVAYLFMDQPPIFKPGGELAQVRDYFRADRIVLNNWVVKDAYPGSRVLGSTFYQELHRWADVVILRDLFEMQPQETHEPHEGRAV
jgi:hypothetical protein